MATILTSHLDIFKSLEEKDQMLLINSVRSAVSVNAGEYRVYVRSETAYLS